MLSDADVKSSGLLERRFEVRARANFGSAAKIQLREASLHFSERRVRTAKAIYEKHCDTLEVAPGAPMSEIESSFREMVKVWHPDRFPDNPQLQIRATKKTSELTKAFQWLRKNEASVRQIQAVSEASSSERILTLMRRTLSAYVERHPGTPDQAIYRAVRVILHEVTPEQPVERVYPFRFFSEFSMSKAGRWIGTHRRHVLGWGVVVLMFLFLGSR